MLVDPERRRRYDRGDTIDLSDLFSGMGGFDDILRSVFGDGGLFGSSGGRSSRGRDVLVRVEVDLAEAAFGTDVGRRISRPDHLPHCSGQRSRARLRAGRPALSAAGAGRFGWLAVRCSGR